MRKNYILLIFLTVCFSMILTGCDSSKDSQKKQVVFLNNLISISDKLDEYEKSFEKLHPDIDIKIESIGDQYENISVTRLNAGKAGDVMIIPSYMSVAYYPDYYELLYSVDEALEKYRFSDIRSVNGQVYSIPLAMNISGGILCDMKILNDAGIEKAPESLEELKDALKAVKSKTDAVPLYSDARGESELTCWNSLVYTLSHNPDYNEDMISKDDLFSKENGYYDVYKFLYECVNENLIEDAFTNSKWNDGIKYIKEGKLACAVVSLDMYEDAKKEAMNKESLIYIPLKSSDGQFYFYGKPSYGIGINKDSTNKEEAKMWLEYLLDDTDFLDYAGDSSILVKNSEKNYEECMNGKDIKIIYPHAMEKEKIGVFEKIDNEACLGIYGGSFAFNLINDVSQNNRDYYEMCSEWNSKWNSARKEISKN